MQYNVGESTFDLGEVEFKLFIFENVKIIEDSPIYRFNLEDIFKKQVLIFVTMNWLFESEI